MEITLYFHETESEVPGGEGRLRVEIRGPPDCVERIVRAVREEVKKWEYWRET